MNTLITARFEREYLKQLSSYISNVKYAGYGVTKNKASKEKIINELKDVELLITEFEDIDSEVIEAADRLKVIVCCRNEPFASIDIEAATKRGIPVLFTGARNAVSVAEFTMGLLLTTARNISITDYLLKYTDELTTVDYEDKKGEREGVISEWSMDPRAPFNIYGGPELCKKKLGIIGYGSIGREIAKRGLAFDMQLYIFDPYLNPDAIKGLNAKLVDLDTLMKESDYITISCKVTPETIGLISKEKIALMKPTAYIINTARAPIMDYDALYEAVKAKRIAGAALDVYPHEPIQPDFPFLKLRNVVLTPHLAGSAYDIPNHHSEIAVDNLLTLFKGQRPKWISNPEVLERFFYNEQIASTKE